MKHQYIVLSNYTLSGILVQKNTFNYMILQFLRRQFQTNTHGTKRIQDNYDNTGHFSCCPILDWMHV